MDPVLKGRSTTVSICLAWKEEAFRKRVCRGDWHRQYSDQAEPASDLQMIRRRGSPRDHLKMTIILSILPGYAQPEAWSTRHATSTP
jgi:hypothetical protein